MTRRGFFKLVAKAAIAATALHVLPVSVLPLKGELHDAIFETCLLKARRLWYEYYMAHNNWRPNKGVAGIAFFRQLEVDLTDGERVTFFGKSSKDWEAILIKGTPIYYSDTEPVWGIRYGGRG